MGFDELDDTDRTLLDLLLADGKMTNRGLASRIGISESAVSVRIRKLIHGGVLVFTAVVDWETAGFEWFIVCRIKTRTRPPREVACDISRLTQCEAVAVVLGSRDILGYFLATDRAELSRVVDALSAIPGIADLEVDLTTDTVVTQHGQQLFLAVDVPSIRLPAPRIALDDLDVSIMQALIEDGRQSSRSIARSFNVSEGTVRARTARLSRSGLAKVVAMVEPVALGMAGVIASISVRAERTLLDTMINQFVKMPNVVFAARCLGGFDVHLTVTASDPCELMEFVGTKIQSVVGVMATDTLLFVDAVRFSPYLKRLPRPE